MAKIAGQKGQVASDFRAPDPLLPSAEELKPDASRMLAADVAPLQTREVMDLIGAVRTTDHLRLHVPLTSNPFQNGGIATRHDYFVLNQLLARATNSQVADEIVDALQEELPDISEESRSFMQASLKREQRMLELIAHLMDSVAQIHYRIAGSQEG